MKFGERPDILPIVQSASNRTLSSQRDSVASMTLFVGEYSSTAICTFLRTSTAESVSVDEKIENILSVKHFKTTVAIPHSLVGKTLEKLV